MKRTLRVASLVFAGAAIFAFTSLAHAQIDFAFGVSTTTAPGPGAANGSNHQPVSLTGGTYPGFSGDVLFFHHLGFGGEIFWKANRANYGGDSSLPFRPIFYDFNAVYSPKLASHTSLELVAGIGAQSTRFYCSSCFNPFTGTNYASVNHFMGDFGGGIKFYPKGGFFVRPEARLYLVNNNAEFSSARVGRYGVSIGYTFK